MEVVLTSGSFEAFITTDLVLYRNGDYTNAPAQRVPVPEPEVVETPPEEETEPVTTPPSNPLINPNQ